MRTPADARGDVTKRSAEANHQLARAHQVCLSVFAHVSVLRVFFSCLPGGGEVRVPSCPTRLLMVVSAHPSVALFARVSTYFAPSPLGVTGVLGTNPRQRRAGSASLFCFARALSPCLPLFSFVFFCVFVCRVCFCLTSSCPPAAAATFP